MMRSLTLIAIIFTQLDKIKQSDDAPAGSNDPSETILGLSFIGIACFSSAIAGVYYEKLVKTGAQQSVIVRNLQLSTNENSQKSGKKSRS